MNGKDMNERQQQALDGIISECTQAKDGGFFSIDYVVEKLRIMFYEEGYDIIISTANERRSSYLSKMYGNNVEV